MGERVKRAPPQPGDANYRPASGMGWGGPPKGRGNGNPGRPATRETIAEMKAKAAAMSPDEKERRKAAKAAKRDRMLAVLEKVAFSTKASDANKVNAADKWLDRTEGRPVQPNANYDGGKKTLEELVKESMASE